MSFEKPLVIDVGMSEGVYAASGACDCFSIENIHENADAAMGYFLEWNIVHNQTHSHTVETDWANLYAEITFTTTIPATVTVRNPANAVISGNKVILNLETVVPADAGDFSYNAIILAGEGSSSLRYQSIESKHR